MARILTHLYLIIMVTFCVMMGNILAVQLGPTIVESISEIVNSADRKVDGVQQSVEAWNKNIIE